MSDATLRLGRNADAQRVESQLVEDRVVPRPRRPDRYRLQSAARGAPPVARLRLPGPKAGQREHPRASAGLVHRHNEPNVTAAELDLERRGVADLAAALAPPDQVVSLTAIDADRTIFRLDLASLGWSAEQWRQLAVRYPYGVSSETPADEAIRIATGDRLPTVRADWFVVALSRPPLGSPGGTLGLWTKGPPEKVQVLLRAYAEQSLDLVRAARELGVGIDALRRPLGERGRPARGIRPGTAPRRQDDPHRRLGVGPQSELKGQTARFREGSTWGNRRESRVGRE
jgi:hypothetical protein